MPDDLKSKLNENQTDVILRPILNDQNQIVDVLIISELSILSVASILQTANIKLQNLKFKN